MNPNRRNFLFKGVVAASGIAAATAGVDRFAPATDPADAGTSRGGAGAVPPAGSYLGPDGKLVRLGADGPRRMPLPVLDPKVRQGIPGKRFVMVIDLARCDGCGQCQVACAKMHFIPPTRQYIKVLRMQDAEYTAPYYFPQPCYHCDNPPCTKVCPVDATFKRQDGIVLVDNERCIGCRFCMAACPYGARSFNWERPQDPPEATTQPYSPETGFPRRLGTVEKCDFCADMAANGQLPSCASGCPMGAIYYGDQNEDAVTNSRGETVRFSTLIRDNAGYRHMEELGTEPRVYYLPAKGRAYPPPPGHEAGAHKA
jgi:molybdopterin-containing oxidoreductase family iron-sulfur binding subunit